MRLADKVALVTGSSRGIGRGIAVEMAREGADVTVNYRTHRKEAEAAAEEIRGLGRKAVVCQADVSRREEVDRMVAATVQELGKVDVCVNNAAATIRRPFLEFPAEEFQWVIDQCLMSVFHVSQACAREMVRQGSGGAILLISSVHAFVPVPTSGPYNACKAGIEHLGHTMAEELLPYRIRVNTIEPGWIDTPGERRLATEEELQAAARGLPWGRLGTIQEVGQAAAFLCSPEADYITAACLRVDGGFWLPSRKG